MRIHFLWSHNLQVTDSFNSQLNHGMQFVSFVIIRVVIASFYSLRCNVQVLPYFRVDLYN